jgi:uncharacterized damage-inducible protein DinB
VDVRDRLLEYDRWANGETLTSLERMGAPPASALSLVNHVLAAEAGWLRRMGQETAFEGFWPGDDLVTLRRAWADALPALWASFLADPTRSDSARTISYVNSKGERWTSTVEDVLLHVVIHSAYHRGQVAAAVRAAGGEPAVTDSVHATRTGLVR